MHSRINAQVLVATGIVAKTWDGGRHCHGALALGHEYDNLFQ